MPRRRLPQPPLDPLADLPSARWWQIARTVDPDSDSTAPGHIALLALLTVGAPRKFVERALRASGAANERETARLLHIDPMAYALFQETARGHVGIGSDRGYTNGNHDGVPRVSPPFSNRKSGKRRRQPPRSLMGPGWWRET